MDKINHALDEFREMDALAAQDSPIHRMHPAVKLLLTLLYILCVVSFHKYQLSALAVMALYPILLFQISGIPVSTCFYKLRVILPLVCAVGLLNPFYDRAPLLQIGNVAVSGGVISMITLMLKGVFALMASFLLIATTPMDSLCAALRKLHVPSLLVTLRHDGGISPACAGTEGHPHFGLGQLSRTAAAAEHGPRGGSL